MVIMTLISKIHFTYVILSRCHNAVLTTVQMFTAGRYEYRNKGVDMFIEGLAREYYLFQLESRLTML